VTVSVDIETTIDRPPAEVFAALIDVERYPEWLIASGIVGVERLDPQDQVVDLEPLPRADPAHALVDVVSGDAQDVARVLRTVEASVD